MSRFRRVIVRALMAAALLYSAAHVVQTGIRSAWSNFAGDFLAAWPGYYAAGWNPSLYIGSYSEYWWKAPIWCYGPLMHLLYLPFTFLPDIKTAYRGILLCSYAYALAAFFITTCAVVRRPKTLAAWTLFIALWANFYPLYETLLQNNIELLELALLAGAWALLARGRDRAAGAALGAATMAKFLPAIFVPYLIWKRRWRALSGLLAVMLPVALFIQLTLGWEHNFLVEQFRRGGTYGVSYFTNQALSGIVMRFGQVVAWWVPALPVFDDHGRWAAIAHGVSLTAGLLLALLLGRFGRPGVERWEWSLLTMIMILVPPHAQPYYAVFLLLPFSVVLDEAIRGSLSRSHAAAAAAAFLMVGWPLPMSAIEAVWPPPDSWVRLSDYWLLHSLPAAGAGLLLLVVCQRLVQDSRRLAAAERRELPAASDDAPAAALTGQEPQLSLIVPFYNEGVNVDRVMEPLLAALDASGCAYEVIPVDNGSADDTGGRLRGYAARHPTVRLVSVPVNEGYGWGIIQGLAQARGAYAGYMSGDGQIRPDDPVRVCAAMVAAGAMAGKIVRNVRHDGWLRRVNSAAYNAVCRAGFGLRSQDVNGTPKVLARPLLDRLQLSSKDWFIDFELMLKLQWLGQEMLEVPTEYLARSGGVSKVKLSAVWEFARNMVEARWGGRFAAWRSAGGGAVTAAPAAREVEAS